MNIFDHINIKFHTMKNQNKFKIEKFQIAKLTNLRAVVGGTNNNGGNDPTTDTKIPKPKPPGPIIIGQDPDSTIFCAPR
jgi:hypothetical protein